MLSSLPDLNKRLFRVCVLFFQMCIVRRSDVLLCPRSSESNELILLLPPPFASAHVRVPPDARFDWSIPSAGPKQRSGTNAVADSGTLKCYYWERVDSQFRLCYVASSHYHSNWERNAPAKERKNDVPERVPSHTSLTKFLNQRNEKNSRKISHIIAIANSQTATPKKSIRSP